MVANYLLIGVMIPISSNMNLHFVEMPALAPPEVAFDIAAQES
jgi:hypothetical protein